MVSSSITRGRFALAVALVSAALVGCGGGGSDPAQASNTTLGPGASSVVSSDGKVTVAVGDNALQAATTVTIVPAIPDATTAADPSLVPGTTYDFTAPAIQVSEQVLITIESPLAVEAAAPLRVLPTGQRRPLAPPAGFTPPPTCLVNAPTVLGIAPPLANIWVEGVECPQSPAPACLKVQQIDPKGADLFTGAPATPGAALCAPAADIVAIPAGVACPSGYREVTGEPAFDAFATQYAFAKICQRLSVAAPPVLGVSGKPSSITCTVKSGKFLCPTGTLPSGRLSVLWDRAPPPKPSVLVLAPGFPLSPLPLPENGPPGTLNTAIHATDAGGLGAVELLEIAPNPGSVPSTYGEGVNVVPAIRRWSAPASLFAGAPVLNVETVVQVPYSLADPALRSFFVRSFDRSGNSTLSDHSGAAAVVDAITIELFTYALIQPLGDPVPALGWRVRGASAVSIDQGVGGFANSDSLAAATEGLAVLGALPAPGTTYTLTATHPNRGTKTAVVKVGVDVVAPTVTLAASPGAVFAPGSTTLTASASDAVGVTKVEFYRGGVLIGTDSAAPYAQAVSFVPGDVGMVAFTAKAYDAASNSATSAVLNFQVVYDVTPPTVSLLASPTAVVVPGTTTLTANPLDASGIARVEFYRGLALLATATSPPWQTSVALTAADIGTSTFTAKAIDIYLNNAISAPVVVSVGLPTGIDTYASPTGVDAGNAACAQATPCRSIAKAAALTQPGGTVWLMNGDYTGTTQPAPIAIPAGLTLRALTPGLAAVGQQIVLQGNATVVGIVLRRNGFGDTGSIAADAGTVTLDGVKAIGSAASGSGFPAVLALGGTAHVTMTPGNIADYTDQLTPVGQGTGIYGALAGNARLTINGGLFGGAVLGGADGVYGAFNRGAFNLTGSSRLDLNNVVLHVESSGIFLFGDATQVNLNGSVLHAAGNIGPGYGIHAAKGTPHVSLVNSSISGFDNSYSRSSVGIAVGSFAQPGAALTLSATNSVVASNNTGILVTEQGTTASSLTFTGTGVGVASNPLGGIVCRDACSVDIAGGEVSANGSQDPAALGSSTPYGGLWLGMADKTYFLKLRNVQVIDNRSLANGNSNQPGNSGITIGGSASSGFDLGSGSSPGNNGFTGNTTGDQTSGLNVAVSPGITVRAVGNTWIAGQQGSNVSGNYLLGTAPCGSSSCSVTGGAGVNYRVTSGTLRLAE
ncbi:MAG: Ig-like domain-containing protein [Caldimonas sp.]